MSQCFSGAWPVDRKSFATSRRESCVEHAGSAPKSPRPGSRQQPPLQGSPIKLKSGSRRRFFFRVWNGYRFSLLRARVPRQLQTKLFKRSMYEAWLACSMPGRMHADQGSNPTWSSPMRTSLLLYITVRNVPSARACRNSLPSCMWHVREPESPAAVTHSPNCHGRLGMHWPISSDSANQHDSSHERNVRTVVTSRGLLP